jgi:hypothetical protein
MDTDLSPGLRYKVEGYEGVAFWFDKWCLISDHHEACLLMVMVGDDYRHHIDKAMIETIDDDEYCSGCGQIGCGW